MNIYDRIINILLEARVEMYIQDRLDEGKVKARNKAMKNAFTDKLRHMEAPPSGRSGQRNLSSREKEAAEDHEVRLARKVKFPTDASEKRAVGRANLRQGYTYSEAKEEKGHGEVVKGAVRDERYKDATGAEDYTDITAKRLKKHAETHGRGAPGRAIRARGRRQVESTMPKKPKRTGGIIMNPKKEMPKKKTDYITPSTVPYKKGNKPS